MATIKPKAKEERELSFQKELIPEKTFNQCVRLAVRDILKDAELSPQKVADRTGLDGANLRRVLAGKRNIGLFTLFQLAAVCEVDPEEFVQKIVEHLGEELKGRARK